MDGAFTEITISNVPVDNNLIEQGHVLSDWFIFRDERHFGPLSSKQVRRFLSKKMISIDHHIWRPGFTGWKTINDIECFRSYGRKVIRNLDDDEFSFRARLSAVDRIFLEERELEFVEGQKKKRVVQEEEDFSFMSVVRKTGRAVGFSKEGNDYARIVLTSALFTLLIGFIVLFNNREPYPFLESLTPEIQNKLLEISSAKDNNTNPEFVMFEKQYNVSDPSFIVGTNLPVGSRIKVEINGDPETLLGSYRFERSFEMRLKNKLFLTESIREDSGKYIAPGSYIVSAICLSCASKNKEIYKSTFMFGVKDQVLYQKELKRFHLETRQNAQLELSELKDLSRTLDRQYQKTLNQFVLFSAKKNTDGWDKFSTMWLANQKKFIDLFEQMNSEKFVRQLYYSPIYEAYDHLILQLFELHLMQDSVITNSGIVDETSKNVSKMSQEVSLRLATLRAQIDQMEMNFSKTNGLPSQEGLKLTHL